LEDKTLLNRCNSHRTSVHVAFIVKRGQVIAKAMNSVGSRSRGCGYSDYTIHAERNVVKELGDLSKLKGASLYVVRLSRNKLLVGEEKITNSEPCYDCCVFLKKCHEKYGLAKVFYTTHSFVELDFDERPEKKVAYV
jgi:hypothetical protein